MTIQVLPESIISRISAGEVITSPYNIIKELLENSLDAKSKEISIELSSNLKTILIKDNGTGIRKEDLEKVCLNHYTSKISSTEDLKSCGSISSTSSFGFRGEALHSISLCSHVRISSREINENISYEAIYNGDQCIEIKQKAFEGTGTLIEIRDIFFNNKIREDFYSKNKKELFNCVNLIKSYGIIFSGIELRIDGKVIIEADYSNRSIVNVGSSLNIDLYNNDSIEFNNIDGIKSSYNQIIKNRATFIHKNFESFPSMSFFDKNLVLIISSEISLKNYSFILIINRRLVENKNLKNKVLHKFRSATGMKNSYMNPFVFIELLVDFIDVNVHPSKMEVLVDDNLIFERILTEISKLLGKRDFSFQEGDTNALLDNTDILSSFGSNLTTSSQLKQSLIASNSQVLNKSSTHYHSDSMYDSSFKIYNLPETRSLNEFSQKIEVPKIRPFLTSIKSIETSFIEEDFDFLKKLIFVGNLKEKNVFFVQHKFNLLKIESKKFVFQAFYQKIVRDFGGFECREIEGIPIKVDENLIELFKEYFSIFIDGGNLIGVPVIYDIICDKYKLITLENIKKSTEIKTLKDIINVIASAYSEDGNQEMDSVLFNKLKSHTTCTIEILESISLLTDLKEIYKGFDRC